MRLLLKWLRPEVIPSPRRKDIPFGEKARLFLYKRCILILKKWYSRYAFSDSIFLNGISPIKLVHEHRDYDFENELKRLHIPLPVNMVDHTGPVSSAQERNKKRPFYKNFYFEDQLHLEADGQIVSISHGKGRLFNSKIKGKLKESDRTSSILQYVFTGSLNNIKSGRPGTSVSNNNIKSSSTSFQEIITFSGLPTDDFPQSKKIGGLFGSDPLLEKKSGASKQSKHTQPSFIKIVEGVEIDESF